MSARPLLAAALTLIAPLAAHPGQAADSDQAIVATIDKHIQSGWGDFEVQPSARADDYEFARRVSLDVIGRIPTYGELREFVDDKSDDRRTKFVNGLLDDDGYVKNWTTIWGNLLVGRGGNGRGALDRWLRRRIYENKAYNKFVHELVSAEGSSDENGAVAFLASHLNDGAVPATSVTARLFLGLQVQCTQCHNHPFNDWQQSQFWGMNSFFTGTRRNNTGGQLSLVDQPSEALVFYEKRNGIRQAVFRRFVDGTIAPLNDTEKPRKQLADLITTSTQPYLAQAQVNRLWGRFFGHAFTRPADDMGPHNPPTHPELLEYLAAQFQQSGYDVKRLIRWIAASEAYNLTSRTIPENEDNNPSAGDSPAFASMYVKQFTAEQLYDSLIVATDAHKSGRSAEAAENQRRAWLTQFIRTFGTDDYVASTTFEGSIPRALTLMNGQVVQSGVNGGRGGLLQRVLASRTGELTESAEKPKRRARPLSTQARQRAARARAKTIPKRIETLYLLALSRPPTDEELTAFSKIYEENSVRDPVAGLQDVFWALLNSNEFISNH
ncbi:MAG: hypothetical protein CMJ48_13395 [Planctomycetaceae bacterium]|nr:hypothetical protein [Planctomycetaceae bacterium]